MRRLAFLGSLSLPLLLVVLGMPMALGRVHPNRIYGFRTAGSFASPDAWYRLNAVAGIAMVVAGVLAFAIVLLVWRSSRATPRIKVVCSCVVVVIAITVATLVPFFASAA